MASAFLISLATLHDAAGEATGVIAGRVTNEHGAAIEGIWVIALLQSPDPGPQEQGLTGPDGRYEITAPPEQYRVLFRDSLDSAGAIAPSAQPDRPVLYQEICYQQQASCESPDLVTVSAGQRVDDVDAQMQAITPTISGHVYNAAGKPVPGIIVGSFPDYDPESRTCAWPPNTNGHGRYVVRLPGAGDYSLYFVDGSGPCGFDTGLPSPSWSYSSESYRDKNESWRGKTCFDQQASPCESPDLVHADSDSIIDGIDAVLEKCSQSTYDTEPSKGYVDCPGTGSGSSKPSGKHSSSSGSSSSGKGSPSPSPSQTGSMTPSSEPSSGSTTAASPAAARRGTRSSGLVAFLSALGLVAAVLAGFAVRRRRRASA